jgi:hypothetical protein
MRARLTTFPLQARLVETSPLLQAPLKMSSGCFTDRRHLYPQGATFSSLHVTGTVMNDSSCIGKDCPTLTASPVSITMWI